MLLVVDTSAIIAVLLNEAQKPQIIQATTGAELIAPASLYWEIGNAFSAMLKRNRATLEQLSKALDSFQKIPLRLVNIELKDALSVVDKTRLYAYDAYILNVALKHHAPILSLDKGLKSAANELGIQLVEITP